MLLVSKHWTADGNAVIVDCGAKVIRATLYIDTGQTNPLVYVYSRQWEQEDTLYGILNTGSTGVLTRMTTAATGMEAYDAKQHGVLVPNPAGGVDNFRVPTIWSTATDYSSGFTARSATAAGSVVWPPSGSRNEMIYELTTATGTGTSAPSSWPTTPGDTATDGGSNVWTAREQNAFVKGAQGITVGATTQTDGRLNQIFCECQDPGKDVDIAVGDVDNLAATDYA